MYTLKSRKLRYTVNLRTIPNCTINMIKKGLHRFERGTALNHTYIHLQAASNCKDAAFVLWQSIKKLARNMKYISVGQETNRFNRNVKVHITITTVKESIGH